MNLAIALVLLVNQRLPSSNEDSSAPSCSHSAYSGRKLHYLQAHQYYNFLQFS